MITENGLSFASTPSDSCHDTDSRMFAVAAPTVENAWIEVTFDGRSDQGFDGVVGLFLLAAASSASRSASALRPALRYAISNWS